MVRLAEARRDHVFLDPMCGAGTILAEHLAVARRRPGDPTWLWGGDLDATALRSARANLRPAEQVLLARWDARRLPFADASVDRIVSNPPFGKQLSDPKSVGRLYRAALREYERVMRPAGRVVLLVSEVALLREAARAVGWKQIRQLRVRVLGQSAEVTVWRKP
jgi:23S rRNA G2445 N2-methylase RlmL